MEYLFFLSHASVDYTAEVDRFFGDLTEEVRRRIGWADKDDRDQVGFIDNEGLKVGAHWSPGLIAALNGSRVLVILLSPSCFKSQGCGREVRVFEERIAQEVRRGRGASDAWPCIIPVIWTPWPKGTQPAVLNALQWNHRSLPKPYRELGMLEMMQLAEIHGVAYREAVLVLAKSVVSATDKPLPPLSVPLTWEQVTSSFDPQTAPLIGGSRPDSLPPDGHGHVRDPKPPGPEAPVGPYAPPPPAARKRRRWVIGVGMTVGLAATAFQIVAALSTFTTVFDDPARLTTTVLPVAAVHSPPTTSLPVLAPPVLGPSMVPMQAPAPSAPSMVPISAPARPQIPRNLWGRSVHAHRILDISGTPHFGSPLFASRITTDPLRQTLTAGGGQNPINVAQLGVIDGDDGSICDRSAVTRTPDFRVHFRADGSSRLLRFFVITDNGTDATLLINGYDGRWRCNDDHRHPGWTQERMPVIDFRDPASGQYDVWVGSYSGTSSNPATLYVTENDAVHP
jgi:hypothetical protein